MKKIELKDVNAYEAPGHFGMTAMRLHGTEESGATKFWMGVYWQNKGGRKSVLAVETNGTGDFVTDRDRYRRQMGSLGKSHRPSSVYQEDLA